MRTRTRIFWRWVGGVATDLAIVLAMIFVAGCAIWIIAKGL